MLQSTAGRTCSSQYFCESFRRYDVVHDTLTVSVSFLVFTDYCIYWIHRWEHHPLFYKWLHKPHHKWLSTCS